MKLVTAIVKPFKLDDVKAALKDLSVAVSYTHLTLPTTERV